ncbi:MAG: murein biosynthesis integral membrane protein MurJ [Ignavibacteriales bacterium]
MNGEVEPGPVAGGVAVGRAAILIAALSTTAKVAGFLRDRTLAVSFGVGSECDAYIVASWLPGLMVTMMTAAIAAALLPVFTGLRVGGDEARAWRVSSSILNMTVIVSGILAVAGMVWAGPVARMAAPGFSASTAGLTASLLRITLPSTVFIGVFSVASAVLHSYRRFAPPAAGPILVNAATIVSVVVLGPRIGVASAAYGLLAGYALQAVALLLFLPRAPRSYTPTLGLRDPGTIQVLRLAVPVVAYSAFSQASGLIEKYIASGLEAGSVSALAFANKLVLLPVGLFSVAVSTAMFPGMAEAAGREDYRYLRETIEKGMRMLAYMTIPAAAGLMYLRHPIVSALFERGAFDAGATAMTASAVLWYSAGMLFQSVQPILERAFNASRDTLTPSAAGVARIVLYTALAVPLSRYMGHQGIALTMSVTSALTCMSLGVVLCRRLEAEVRWRDVAWFLLRVSAGCGVMTAAAAGALRLVTPVLGGRLAPVLASVGLGAAAYFCVTALLRVEEAVHIVRLVESRVRRRRSGKA